MHVTTTQPCNKKTTQIQLHCNIHIRHTYIFIKIQIFFPFFYEETLIYTGIWLGGDNGVVDCGLFFWDSPCVPHQIPSLMNLDTLSQVTNGKER